MDNRDGLHVDRPLLGGVGAPSVPHEPAEYGDQHQIAEAGHSLRGSASCQTKWLTERDSRQETREETAEQDALSEHTNGNLYTAGTVVVARC